jgi:hypothetical protein
MNTLEDVPQTHDAKTHDSSVLAFVAVALGGLASLLWVAFLGWGLGWVVAQLINLFW